MDRRSIIGFVHIPKTGGTTIKFVLRNSTYGRHCDLLPLTRGQLVSPQDFDFVKKVFFFGLHSMAGHGLRSSVGEFSAPVAYFTIIRDPLRRCLSHYQHIKRSRRREGTDISFNEFIQQEEFTNVQVRRIAGEPNIQKAKEELAGRFFFVGLTEHFAESMTILQKLCPYSLNLEYKRLHITKDNSAKEEVLADPTLSDLLRENNLLDMELYAFVRDELFPIFRTKAGLSAQEFDEKAFYPSSHQIRYKLTRCYNQAVYRNLNKLRRFISRP